MYFKKVNYNNWSFLDAVRSYKESNSEQSALLKMKEDLEDIFTDINNGPKMRQKGTLFLQKLSEQDSKASNILPASSSLQSQVINMNDHNNNTINTTISPNIFNVFDDDTSVGVLGSSHISAAGPSSLAVDSDPDSDREFNSRESTPSSTSSKESKEVSNKFYLIHDGASYEYKLNKDSVRWLAKGYDVSNAFFKYRDFAISKAEDSKNLNKHEQLALDGIMLIDNQFHNTDVVDFEKVDDILDDINRVEYFVHDPIQPQKLPTLSSFAFDMANKKINSDKIFNDIRRYEPGHDDNSPLCDVLKSLANTFCADFSTNDLNEATLVHDTIDIFLKAYFPNTTLMKSIGADSMIKVSSERFSRLDPSLSSCGKRADFSVVSNKSNHLLFTLEAKANKTKYIDDLIKLCRELKDSIKSIHDGGYAGIPLCGIVMKGSSCDVYVMDHKYDGLYRVVLLKRFHLPRDCYDMNQLVSIFPLFDKLKSIVGTSARMLRNSPVAAARIPEDIVSMHTSIIVRAPKRSLDINDPNVRNARRRLFPPK